MQKETQTSAAIILIFHTHTNQMVQRWQMVCVGCFGLFLHLWPDQQPPL